MIYIIIIIRIQMKENAHRKPLVKSQDGNIYMSKQNLKICNINQDRYETPQLNDAFELHYYGFCNIANLQLYENINTLYLNNNTIKIIENLSPLKKLITLNLANNRITAIAGLEGLTQLFILDLSGNKIQRIENMKSLRKLTTFNISANLLSKPNSIADLEHNKALTCLNLSSNPLPNDQQLFGYLQKIPLLTLFLKDTQFSRGIASYRKQTICHLKQLTFLDERPVTKDERMLTQAWKKGGLQAQKQARKLIQQTKDQKNKKIYQEMIERSQKVQKLRKQLFEKLSRQQQLQLQQHKIRYKAQMQKQPRDEFEIRLIDKKIQELESYLKYFKEDTNYMDVSQARQVPNNLCERHEKDAIYIYGVKQQQLPKIKQVYYPDDPRPLIAKDFEKQQQLRWIENYNQILQGVCHEYLNSSQFIVPLFNIKVHEFDKQHNRKARRFKEQQLKDKIMKFTKIEAAHQIENEHQAENQLNNLD